MITQLQSRRGREWFSILSLVTVVTAVNLTKPFHIDDTAYLEIAERIIASPLHATSGLLNWHNVSEPIHLTNQPHLYFYILAGWMALFGSSEVAIHALVAIFSTGTILAFVFLAREIAPGRELWLAWLLFAGPAFLPSQNLMVDVPLLFFVLLFFSGLVIAAKGDERGWGVAASASAAAVLTKYTALVLLPILAVAAVLLRRPRQLRVLSIPLLALVCWSLLNLWDYGGIHVLERPSQGSAIVRSLVRFPGLILCLGSVAPLTLLIMWRGAGSRRVFLGYGALCVGIGLLTALAPRNAAIRHDYSPQLAVLSGVFVANGLWVLGGAVLVVAREWPARWTPLDGILLMWIVGLLLFLSAYSPDAAVRHVLLIIPPLLLIVGKSFDLSRFRWRGWGTVAVSSGLALLLAVSDWAYADVYRTQARLIREQLGPQSTIWYTGHWGWQWYARQEHMVQYQTGISVLGAGDFLVEPLLVDKQDIDARDQARLTLNRRIVVDSTPWTAIRTMSMLPWGGFYTSTMTTPPWRFSNQPLEEFDIFELGRD